MNLIRNGSFEEATLLHWTNLTPGSLVLDAPNSHRGGGCAKFTSSGAALERFQNTDAIEVTPDEIIAVTGYVKSSASRSCRLYIREYDSDLNEISHAHVVSQTSTAGYELLIGEHLVSEQACYARVSVGMVSSTVGEIFYFDDIGVVRYSPVRSVYTQLLLGDLDGVTVSGGTSGAKIDRRAFTTYIADIRVHAANGTNPTLDVNVVETDMFGYSVVVGSFAQKTVASGERIVLSSVTGRQLFLEYVIGGTNPEFYFDVYLTAKR